MTTNLGATGRAVRGLSIGSYKALERRRAQFNADALQELDLQYQIPISGRATSDGSPFEVEIDFEVEFYNAPEQRDSPLTMPHFTYGFVVDNTSGIDISGDPPHTSVTGVVAEAAVGQWVYQPDSGAYVGAWIIGSCRVPMGETYSVYFDGLLHVNFQGYGAITENAALDVGTQS